MPSSLIFAALAAAWLVVLVPMVAKRRQEVVRTASLRWLLGYCTGRALLVWRTSTVNRCA